MSVPVRSISLLLITVAVGIGVGRILSAERMIEPSAHRAPGETSGKRIWPVERPLPMPTFSSNDISRWATVRALVDDGTYVVGERLAQPSTNGKPYTDVGIISENGWKTIDLVLHPDKQVFYSTKPPLLSTLVAGLYWLLKTLFGWTLTTRPFAVVRTILLLVNALPFAIYLVMLDRWLERFTVNSWTRLAILGMAAFGTLVTPFMITFNNHNIATYCVLFALDAVLKIWWAGTRHAPLKARHFLRAGLFTAFAAANELPALAFAAATIALLFYLSAARTLLFAIPPALVVALGFFGTNYLAVEQWRPAYSEFGGPWYEYEGSHWTKPKEGEEKKKTGIDWARHHETRAEYALHLLVGHHGLFSLTPIWFLAMLAFFHRPALDRTLPAHDPPWFLPWLTAALTVVVVGFYLVRSDNYGGWSNGPRWLMWLSPLWLLTMIPVVDRLAATARGRAIVYVLIAISVVSAHYSLTNPWRMPWIYDLMLACGWHGY